MLTSCFICQIVFIYRIKKYNITGYNCSDSITNELISKGTKDNNKQILYITINFYLDVFQILINYITLLIGLIIALNDKLNKKHSKLKEKEDEEEQSQDKYDEIIDFKDNSKTNYPDIPLNTNYPEFN